MTQHEIPGLLVCDVYDTLVEWRGPVHDLAAELGMDANQVFEATSNLAAQTDLGLITYAEYSAAVSVALGIEGVPLGERVMAGLQPIEPMHSLVYEFLDAGTQVALATNVGSGALRMTFESEGALPPIGVFNRVFESCKIGVAKPDHGFFAHVESETGIEPGRIAFLDDNPANVATASARGWQGHLVDTSDFGTSADSIRRHYMSHLTTTL